MPAPFEQSSDDRVSTVVVGIAALFTQGGVVVAASSFGGVGGVVLQGLLNDRSDSDVASPIARAGVVMKPVVQNCSKNSPAAAICISCTAVTVAPGCSELSSAAAYSCAVVTNSGSKRIISNTDHSGAQQSRLLLADGVFSTYRKARHSATERVMQMSRGGAVGNGNSGGGVLPSDGTQLPLPSLAFMYLTFASGTHSCCAPRHAP